MVARPIQARLDFAAGLLCRAGRETYHGRVVGNNFEHWRQTFGHCATNAIHTPAAHSTSRRKGGLIERKQI